MLKTLDFNTYIFILTSCKYFQLVIATGASYADRLMELHATIMLVSSKCYKVLKSIVMFNPVNVVDNSIGWNLAMCSLPHKPMFRHTSFSCINKNISTLRLVFLVRTAKLKDMVATRILYFGYYLVSLKCLLKKLVFSIRIYLTRQASGAVLWKSEIIYFSHNIPPTLNMIYIVAHIYLTCKCMLEADETINKSRNADYEQNETLETQIYECLATVAFPPIKGLVFNRERPSPPIIQRLLGLYYRKEIR